MPEQLLIIEVSSSTVAWYGAIVATASAFIATLNFFRDRARVKISLQKGLMIMNARPPYSEDKKYFAIHITNKGRRPVAVGNVAVKYVSGETFILAGSIDNQETRIITEEKPHTMILTAEETMDLPKLHTIFVYDLSGRKYVKYLDNFPTFRKLNYFMRNFK